MSAISPTWLTTQETRLLLDSKMSPRDRAIVAVFLYAGLRSNELSMLNVTDINFDVAEICVKQGKRGKRRIIPLHPSTASILKTYLDGRITGPVFLSERKQRISNRRLRTLIKSLGEQAGLDKDLHPTALRHTFAVGLVRGMVDLRAIQALMGHSTYAMSAWYALHGITDKTQAINQLWSE